MSGISGKTQDGHVVSVVNDKLTTTCSQGRQHRYTLEKNARVTCEGKASKLADLQPGTHVRITIHKDDQTLVTAIESGKHLA